MPRDRRESIVELTRTLNALRTKTPVVHHEKKKVWLSHKHMYHRRNDSVDFFFLANGNNDNFVVLIKDGRYIAPTRTEGVAV